MKMFPRQVATYAKREKDQKTIMNSIIIHRKKEDWELLDKFHLGELCNGICLEMGDLWIAMQQLVRVT